MLYIMDNSPLYLLSFLSALILFQMDNGSSVVTWCVFNLPEKESGTSSCAAAEPCESATLHNLTAGIDEEDEVVVYLCSSSYSLDNSAAINFTDIENVSIIGQADGSSLNCHDNNYTGLYFRNVSTLTVEHITLSHCGLSTHNYTSAINPIICSFYVENCTNISMTNIGILNSSGAGLVLVNNSGNVIITNSSFCDNGPSSNRNEAGLVIYSTKCGQYDIRGSYFKSNSYIQGSGLNVQLRGQSHDINISIMDCIFLANTATLGGAVFIFLNNSQDINLTISESFFGDSEAVSGINKVGQSNTNSAMQGGAIYIAFLGNSHSIALHISQSSFRNNKAIYKDGVSEDGHNSSGSKNVMQGGAVYITFKECSYDINLKISHSIFYDNKAKSEQLFEAIDAAMRGGALYVAFQNNSSNISMEISESIFGNNKTFSSSTDDNRSCFDANTSERGGAVYILFMENSENISFNIKQSIFGNVYYDDKVSANEHDNCVANTAMQGGALYTVFLDHSNNITLYIVQSNFTNNKATYEGGAIEAGYYETPDNQNNKGNSMQMISCNFISNTAGLGGGHYLYSYPDSRHVNLHKIFTFVDCNWMRNSASVSGSAIYAVTNRGDESSNSLVLNLTNCFLENNSPKKLTCIEKNGKGILEAHSAHVILNGNCEFTDNHESAVYIESSILELGNNAEIMFANNYGKRGGAIRMQDYSTINMYDNSTVNFTNNFACFDSGAIYVYYDNSSETTSRKCFFENITTGLDKKSINMIFLNNTVIRPNKGNSNVSLFAASLHSCDGKNGTPALDLISNFTGLSRRKISTFPCKIKPPDDSEMHVIPGKEKNIIFLDEADNEVEEAFEMANGKIIFVDPEYKGNNYKTLKLLGKPESSENLTLHLKRKDFSVTIFLEQCPPGYVLNNKSCQCSANTQKPYPGIQRCSLTMHQAILLHGFWAGYANGENNDDNFRVSDCPLGYCHLNQSSEIALPDSSRIADLNDSVCSDNRHGRVCGKCKENASVLFHTQGTFNCRKDEHHLCKYGILLYIISEIVPVTFLFMFIILFDIQLTTGALNSFLFYAQIFSTLTISADSYVTFPTGTKSLFEALNFILGFFNLTFFLHPRLSFCLFKGATFFHITIFNYVTVVYALLLVLLVIAVLNSKFNKVFVKLRKRNFSKSIIHGLSGFLVICYARYTNASLRIVTPVTLYGKEAMAKENVLFYYGEIDFFSPDHLPYAIPAIFILITMTLIPPLLLIFFPLYYKTLSLLNMEESRFTKILCKVVPLEKLMPFFDSFQGSFKDKYRYFAGLYFVYRISALFFFSIAQKMITFYGLLELQFVLTLAFHAWIQPYKNKWHNRLDIYIFTILCIINGVSVLNFEYAVSQLNYQKQINILSTLQVLLAYTPLLIMIVHVTVKVWPIMAKKYMRKYQFFYRRERSESDLTLSMIDQSHETEYKKCD